MIPTVSVIVPTYGRPDYHAHVYRTFVGQTYPHKDLWLLDDSPAPSIFFATLRDPRVHYQWTAGRMSIGAKRNELIAQSAGRIIMHQDDDDVYRRHYMATMAGRLGGDALTKLSVWDAKSAYDGSIWRWDTRYNGPPQFAVSGNAPAMRLPTQNADDEDNALWGYGFSYVFARGAWEACPFEDMNLGEDLTFVSKLRDTGAPVTHQADLPDSVVHTIHPRSTSRIYPQECLAWCKPCAMASPDLVMSYGDTQGTPMGVAGAPPPKITLVPGRTYDAIAIVKTSHKLDEMTARAAGYDLHVLGVDDNVQPPHLPPPKKGYRYMNVRVRPKKQRAVRTSVPWPFSMHDGSRVVTLQTH